MYLSPLARSITPHALRGGTLGHLALAAGIPIERAATALDELLHRGLVNVDEHGSVEPAAASPGR